MRPNYFQRICGKTIDLVGIEPLFFEKVIEWRNKPEIKKCFFSANVFTRESQNIWYEQYLNDDSDITCMIVSKSGAALGTVALYAIDLRTRTAEFGRMLIGEEEFRGVGIAREACQLFLAFAFGVLKLRSIYLYVYDWNVKAVRLYNSIGFVTKEHTEKRIKDGYAQTVLKMVLDSWE